MPKKKITPKIYAELRGITLSGVTKAIRKGHNLPGVSSIEKHDRFYLLNVSLKSDGTLDI